MVMQYWALKDPTLSRLTLEAEHVARAPVSRNGVSGQELRRLLESEGFQVFVFHAEVRDLADHLEKGRPLIVCFAPEGKKGLMHFAVVTGLEEDAVLLNDSVRGKLFREPLRRFLPQWRATANWTLLAVPRTSQ